MSMTTPTGTPTPPSAHRQHEVLQLLLTEAGVLVEHRRYRDAGGVRCFTAPRQALDEIGRQAVNEWIEAGYRVGEMMDEIKGGAT